MLEICLNKVGRLNTRGYIIQGSSINRGGVRRYYCAVFMDDYHVYFGSRDNVIYMSAELFWYNSYGLEIANQQTFEALKRTALTLARMQTDRDNVFARLKEYGFELRKRIIHLIDPSKVPRDMPDIICY